MRAAARLLAALALLLATTAAAARHEATASFASLLAPGPNVGGAPDSPAQIRLVRAWTDDAGTGAPGVRYTVFRYVAPPGAAATVRGAGGLAGLAGHGSGVVEDGPLASWEQLGTIVVEGEGGYRLPVNDGSPFAPSPVVGGGPVLNPSAPASAPLRFALDGVRPNPALGRALTVEFALPSAKPARLELLDIMGRRVTGRDVGALGAGRHVVNLSEGRRLAPGIYLLRLTQDTDVRVTRAAVLE